MEQVTEEEVRRWWVTNEFECFHKDITKIVQEKFKSRKEIQNATQEDIDDVFYKIRYIWTYIPTKRKFYKIHVTVSKYDIMDSWYGYPSREIDSKFSNCKHNIDQLLLVEEDWIVDGDIDKCKINKAVVLEGNHRLSKWLYENNDIYNREVYVCVVENLAHDSDLHPDNLTSYNTLNNFNKPKGFCTLF